MEARKSIFYSSRFVLGESGGSQGVPINIVLPVISGVTAQGNTLSVSDGSWLNLPTSHTYQWFSVDPLVDGGVLVTHNGSPVWVGDKTNIGTLRTKLLQAANVGKLVGNDVTAHNAIGASAPAQSEVVGPIT